MTLATSVNGSRIVVPGVYSTLSVEDNLANVTAGARNIYIIGEAAKGAPGSVLDLAKVGFLDYESLKAFYGSGPIVDAARMIFQNQASAIFSGRVNALFCYKTNNSGRAQRNLTVSSIPYAAIAAAEYGEDGNLISSQIQDASVEIKPSLAAFWVPKNESVSLHVRVSGGAEQTAALAAEVLPAAVVAALAGLTGISASGGAQLELIAAGQVGVDSLSVAVDGTYASRITITCTVPFAGADIAAIQPGHVVYIPVASAIAGASAENVGAYSVVSKTASIITLDKISSSSASAEVSPVQPAVVAPVLIAGSQTSAASSELMAFSAISVSVSAVTAAGSASGLEIYVGAGLATAGQRLWSQALQSNPVSPAVSLAASVAVAVSAGSGTFTISAGSFQSIPKVGDVLWVAPTSVLRGAGSANLGAWIVTSAGSTSIIAKKVIGNGVAVASVLLAGQENPFVIQSALASTVQGAKLHASAAERKVKLIAARQSDGLAFPAVSIGGRVVLEIGYVGTSASLTITKSGRLQTAVVGGSGVNLDLQLAKYATIGDLVAFINAKTGYSARAASNALASLNPKIVLDQVSAIGIGTGHSANAFPGRVKSDYADLKKTIEDNFGLISYSQNTAAAAYVGLPDAEALPSFLAGGSAGSTSNAAVLAGLDAGLKINVNQVVPLFSRDASKDVEDGMTEPASSYTLDAINAAVKSHVATASTIDYRKERFGIVSAHASFAATQEKAASLSHERIQMFFQLARVVASDGNIKWFLPWMLSCAVAAGRVQAPLGTPMLRKSFQISDVKHLGDVSLFSDLLVPDYDPDTKDLDVSIEAGLASLRPVTGAGVRMESPDLSTRSRDNDSRGWIYERISSQFILDEVLQTARGVLENFIGSRTSDVSPSVIRKAVGDAVQGFVAGGSLKAFSVDNVKTSGNTYQVTLSVFPSEALEFIELQVLARRTVGETA